ncbi:MAG: transposase [Desulfurellaceae bacterium]|nr:transposase [Desulfurellaceae bacterium]
MLNGILWILRTGAQWAELPSCYPPYQTCQRRFQQGWGSQQIAALIHATRTNPPARACSSASPTAPHQRVLPPRTGAYDRFARRPARSGL